MSRPVVALLTDFGLRDHYVGAMKGVIVGICPDVTLVDISHDVPAHDVLGAALELGAAYRYFPDGTIFLVVVDPGVGSARRGIAVQAREYTLVGPDNGVFSAVLDEVPPKRVVELTDARYRRPTVSRTFEGRDRFAPAAGWLAAGVPLANLGPPTEPACRLNLPRPEPRGDALVGQVLWIDRFGNLVTNVDRAACERFAPGGSMTVSIGAHGGVPFVSTYSDVPHGELCALIGSADRLEVAANGTSAASTLSVARGASVRITRRT
jgi:S-adenosylmethionine hydrolase